MSKSELAAILLFSLSFQGCDFGGGGSVALTSGSESPAATVVLPTGTGQAQISWSANAGEQTGFIIGASVDGVNFKQVQTVPDGTTQATVSNLATATTYYFRVNGYDQAGNSPYTQVLAAKIPAPSP